MNKTMTLINKLSELCIESCELLQDLIVIAREYTELCLHVPETQGAPGVKQIHLC